MGGSHERLEREHNLPLQHHTQPEHAKELGHHAPTTDNRQAPQTGSQDMAMLHQHYAAHRAAQRAAAGEPQSAPTGASHASEQFYERQEHERTTVPPHRNQPKRAIETGVHAPTANDRTTNQAKGQSITALHQERAGQYAGAVQQATTGEPGRDAHPVRREAAPAILSKDEIQIYYTGGIREIQISYSNAISRSQSGVDEKLRAAMASAPDNSGSNDWIRGAIGAVITAASIFVPGGDLVVAGVALGGGIVALGLPPSNLTVPSRGKDFASWEDQYFTYLSTQIENLDIPLSDTALSKLENKKLTQYTLRSELVHGLLRQEFIGVNQYGLADVNVSAVHRHFERMLLIAAAQIPVSPRPDERVGPPEGLMRDATRYDIAGKIVYHYNVRNVFSKELLNYVDFRQNNQIEPEHPKELVISDTGLPENVFQPNLLPHPPEQWEFTFSKATLQVSEGLISYLRDNLGSGSIDVKNLVIPKVILLTPNDPAPIQEHPDRPWLPQDSTFEKDFFAGDYMPVITMNPNVNSTFLEDIRSGNIVGGRSTISLTYENSLSQNHGPFSIYMGRHGVSPSEYAMLIMRRCWGEDLAPPAASIKVVADSLAIE